MSTAPTLRAIIKSAIKIENDIVFIRQRARTVAQEMGFDSQDQTRIATSVSEVARNAYQYAGGGLAEVNLKEHNRKQSLIITVRDQGKGIHNLDHVLSGNYVSKTGMGLGLIGARRLMDRVDIQSDSNGTRVTLEKFLPHQAKWIGAAELNKISDEISRSISQSPFLELQQQNKELIEALASLNEKKEELADLNRELESTNRGVVALYAELDEKALILKKVSEAKSGFLANMTHEFRTPVNSILNISSFLLDPEEGVTHPEHLKQVNFIRKSASDLSDLVNDLLDLSKVEAGKIEVRPTTFTVDDVFGALRGLMRPLLERNSEVSLVFEDLTSNLFLNTDEGKLNQILRNLISNAIKYTEKGSVTVTAQLMNDEMLYFSIQDTGIGVAKEDQERIFEEFVQIDSPLQRKTRGTGLGLPLTYRLTKLLGGKVQLTSELGKGSRFDVLIPLTYHGPQHGNYLEDTSPLESTASISSEDLKQRSEVALIIDDDETARYTLIRELTDLQVATLQASEGESGLKIARSLRPKLIFLDLAMPGLSGFDVLRELMSNAQTRDIPVIVSSSQELTEAEQSYLDDVTLGFLPKNQITTREGKNHLLQMLKRTELNYAEHKS